MNIDRRSQEQHQRDQRDLFTALFNPNPDFFDPQPTASSQPDIQINMDTLQNMMAVQDGSQPAIQHQQGPTHIPPAFLEQQVRLTQLQQLQQLQTQIQTQIFQQQMELLSGSSVFNPANLTSQNIHRDQQQYGLLTPGPSDQLRAQPNTEFVSPMLLHSNNGHGTLLPTLAQAQALLPNYVPPHLLQTPHSAPPNLVFTQTGLPPSASSADPDYPDISPITSPWLEPYPGTGASRTSNDANRNAVRTHIVPSQSSPVATGSKRPSASSSGEETAAPRPVRKRPSRAASNAGTTKPSRTSKSANSTPNFPSITSRPSRRKSPGDVPKDTPSPVDLSMPPPSMLVPLTPTSAGPMPTTTGAPATTVPASQITPATPSNILNMGVTTTVGLQPVPRAKGRGARRNSAVVETGFVAFRPGVNPKTSPVLKPLRPANPSGGQSSPSTVCFQQPVQVRKSSHKAAEQKRRDSLKTSFDDLRMLLPPIPLPSDEGYLDEPVLPGAMPPRGPPKGSVEGPNRGVSKLQLLRCGNDYIKQLKGRVERRDVEMERLRAEVRRLRLAVGEGAGESGEGEAEGVDLERDIDAEERVRGGLFGRGLGYLANLDEGDEDGVE